MNPHFYVYLLKCADGSYYTGHTNDLEARVAAHQQGSIPGYTQTRRPVRLLFAEVLPSRTDALERERQIKGWSRRKKEALIRGDWESLQRLAANRQLASHVPAQPPDAPEQVDSE